MLNLSTNLSRYKKALAVLALLCAVLAYPLVVRADKGDLEDMGGLAKITTAPPMYVTLGKAELLDVGGDIADVMVANPDIIDVTAIQSNRLYVVGMKVGDTNMFALDSAGNIIKRLDVHVRYDLQAIQSLVEEIFPGENVKVGSIHDQILLTGTASTPDRASKIANLVGHYVGDLQDKEKSADELVSNLIEVRGGQQVMLQVRILEASRSVLKELGVKTNVNDADELATTTIFGDSPSSSNTGGGNSVAVGTDAGVALSQDPAAIIRGLFGSGIGGIGTIGLFLSALEQQNLVHTLAEPNLTAVSGEQAGFLAGGEVPVPVGRDQTGNIVVEFHQFGVSLNFRPVVLSEDRISLQMNTEVSSLNYDNALPTDNLRVPAFDVRRADTTVEISSGGSLMIAGLLQSQAVKGLAGLPGISKTPVLGDLIKSDSFQRDETELVVIVTPYLVDSYAQKERATPVPKQANNPLAKAFATNIRQNFDIKDESIFAEDQSFGYLLN